jgi:hypothetical protein
MEEVQYKKWHFCVDVEATREVYQRVKQGSAEDCGCHECQNFVLVRPYIFPEEVQNLFECCGIDLKKEREVLYDGSSIGSLHRYSGWFHFVGDFKGESASVLIMESEQTKVYELVLEPVSPNFQIGFTENAGLFWDEFADHRLVQVEFAVDAPWLFAETAEHEWA